MTGIDRVGDGVAEEDSADRTTAISTAVPAALSASSIGNRVTTAVVGLPDRLTIFAMCAALATAVPVQLSIFHPYFVFPLLAILVAASWRLTPSRLDVSGLFAGSRERTVRARSAARFRGAVDWALIGTVAAILLVAIWVLIQLPYFSEQVAITRDPGIYTVRAFWLLNHASPDVTLTDQLLHLKAAVPDALIDFGAETGRGVRYLQSTTVVPGMLAAAGWLGGPSLLMQGDVLIGGSGLIAVYAVSRRLAGPLFGLVPMVALAASMPMVAFSRVPFTEPLSMVAVMTCLLGLWQGYREDRTALWLLAGAGAGGVALTRIDGWLVIIGGAVGFGIWGAFAITTRSRRRILAALGWYSLAALVVGGLGLTDLIFHSPDYFVVLRPSAFPLMVGAPATMVLAAVVTVLPGLPSLSGWLGTHARVVAIVLVAVVGAVMVVMLIRPLFEQLRFVDDQAVQAANEARQQAEGLVIDPSRSYDEQSLTWMSWYLGWPTVILAGLAGLRAIQQAVRRRRAGLVLVVSVIAVNSALYLNNVSITPDQVWAMRRFLPVILPGGLLLVGWMLSEAFQARETWGTKLFGRLGRRRIPVVTTLIVLFAVGVAVYPVKVWRTGLFTVREWAGQYDLVQQICTEVGNQKVLLLGGNPPTGSYQPSLRAICGAEVVVVRKPTAVLVAEVQANWGDGPFRVVAFLADGAPWTSDPGPPKFSNRALSWEATISHRPTQPRALTTNVWIGTARSDGTVDPD